jgi:Fe-S-cluster containining protein
MANCSKCGACCKHMVLYIGNQDGNFDFQRWLKYHGVNYKNGYVDIPIKCKYLVNNRCMIYNRRPEMCKRYFCEFNKTPFPPKKTI